MNEAVSSYQTALKSAKTKEEKHQIFHNMGNAFMKLKDYGSAVEAYKNALRNNPNDEKTRYNYALAKKMQKENPDQNKDKKDNKQNQDQNKDKKEKKDQQKKDRQGDKDKKDKEQPKPNPQQQKQNQSKQQMENMLKALDNHEQGVRERIQGREQKGKPVSSPTQKDW